MRKKGFDKKQLLKNTVVIEQIDSYLALFRRNIFLLIAVNLLTSFT